MIFQLRYNTKISESLNNSKDCHSIQINRWAVPKSNCNRKLEHLQFTQRNKPRTKYPADMLMCLVSKGLVPVSRQNVGQSNENSLHKNQEDINQTKQEHHYYYDQKPFPSMSVVERQKKKVLPPLQFIGVRPQVRLQSKEKERVETSVTKSCKLVSPTVHRSDQKRQQKRSQTNDEGIVRTTSTPFMQKNLNEPKTSRSGSPNQEIQSKNRLNKQQKISTHQKQTQNQKLQTQQHENIQNQEKKVQLNVVKRKKKPTYIIQQQQQIALQNSQKDKLIQKHTSHRCFINKINFSNNQCIQSPFKMEIPAYYFYVGKGNNGNLIKNQFRQRWWWQEQENLQNNSIDDNINFIWTQLKQNQLIEQLFPFNNLQVNDINQNNESFVQSIEDTGLDFSDSDIDISIKPRSVPIISQQRQSLQIKRKVYPPNFNHLKKLFNTQDILKILNYMDDNECWDSQLLFSDCSETLLMKVKGIQTQQKTDSRTYKMHNHMQDNWHLGNKKALFYNMRNYFRMIKEDYTKYIPTTYHIQQGINDQEYAKFIEHYNRRLDEIAINEKNKTYEQKRDKKQKQISLWIVKPGECTNRGNGINVCQDINEINKILQEELPDGRQRTYIIQTYIDNPFLYNKRKFDIRCYMLLTSQNGIFKGYWYQEGYIRTSSKEFTTKCLNKYIHLTNDAVQSKDDDYGKFELGNKISFLEYQRYLDTYYPQQKFNFFNDIYPKMKNVALDLMKASYGKIDPQRRSNSFELFGLDFMIDDNFKLWLIEANTNPCLELSCPLLSRIIPSMIENLFRIAIDPIFPPPFFTEWPQNKKLFIPDNVLENNRFELIFDELIEKKIMVALYKDQKAEQDCFKIEEEEEEEEKE